MKKRARGGTIREVGSGRWQALLRHDDGRREPLGTFPTWSAAQDAINEARVDQDRGQRADAQKGHTALETLAWEVYEQKVASGDWSEGTARNNRTLLNRHLLPTFGKKAVKDITIRDVDRWWAAKASHPVNRRNGYFLLATIFKHAIRWRYIIESPCRVKNAGKDVSTPRPEHTVDEFRMVVAQLPEYLVVPAWVLFCSHARISELAGLNRADFDPETGAIRIERQDSEIGGRHLKATKTDGSRAVLQLLNPGRKLLAEHWLSPLGYPTSPLFKGPKGARLSARHFRIKWEQACAEAGVENFLPHDVRHTSLTHFARETGGTGADIQRRGRHRSASSSARYQHSSTERDVELSTKAELSA